MQAAKPLDFITVPTLVNGRILIGMIQSVGVCLEKIGNRRIKKGQGTAAVSAECPFAVCMMEPFRVALGPSQSSHAEKGPAYGGRTACFAAVLTVAQRRLQSLARNFVSHRSAETAAGMNLLIRHAGLRLDLTNGSRAAGALR